MHQNTAFNWFGLRTGDIGMAVQTLAPSVTRRQKPVITCYCSAHSVVRFGSTACNRFVCIIWRRRRMVSLLPGGCLLGCTFQKPPGWALMRFGCSSLGCCGRSATDESLMAERRHPRPWPSPSAQRAISGYKLVSGPVVLLGFGRWLMLPAACRQVARSVKM